MKQQLIFLVIILSYCFISTNNLFAQDIRGGDIVMTAYSSGDAASSDAKVRIYREGESVPSILFNWGDGTIDTLYGFPATTNDPEVIADTYFSDLHEYDSLGIYIVEVMDSFLVPGIKNIPNSEHQILHLRDTFYINHPEDFDISGSFHSPLWTQSMVQISQHSNGAVEHNGHVGIGNLFTNLFRSLVPFPAPAYSFPETTDSIVCCVYWNRPLEPGIYAFAIRAASYRLSDQTEFAGASTRLITMKIDSSMIISSTPNTADKDVLLSLFPNPATDYISLQLGSFYDAATHLCIYNAEGRSVYNQGIHLSSQLQQWQVSIKNWSRGVYLLKLYGEDGKSLVERKFIKN